MPPSSDHRPTPISKADLARRAGRSRSTVSGLCSGRLAPAMLPGGRVDAGHPAVVEWASQVVGIDPAVLTGTIASQPKPAPKAKAPPEASANAPKKAGPSAREQSRPSQPRPEPKIAPAAGLDAEELLDLTLREVTDRYGSIQGFEDAVDIRKKLAEIVKLETKNEQIDGRLISRELVRTHVVGLIDEVCRRLLRNAAATIAARIAPGIRSGDSIEETTELVRELLSAELGTVRRRSAAALRRCATDSDPPEVQEPERARGATSSVPSALEALVRHQLRHQAAADVVDAVEKALGHSNRDEAPGTVATILDAHLRRAFRDYSAARERTPDEVESNP